jgi:GNAT superfamily N-acetyltransferase
MALPEGKLMDVQIRKAVPTDAGAIADILRELGAQGWFPHLAGEPQEVTVARTAGHLERGVSSPDHSTYVAEAGGEVVGYVAVHWVPYFLLPGPEGYISELFIREKARGQGIGTRLLEVVKEEARARGCFRLNLENRRDRESYQRAFYRKRGWEERTHMAGFVYWL